MLCSSEQWIIVFESDTLEKRANVTHINSGRYSHVIIITWTVDSLKDQLERQKKKKKKGKKCVLWIRTEPRSSSGLMWKHFLDQFTGSYKRLSSKTINWEKNISKYESNMWRGGERGFHWEPAQRRKTETGTKVMKIQEHIPGIFRKRWEIRRATEPQDHGHSFRRQRRANIANGANKLTELTGYPDLLHKWVPPVESPTSSSMTCKLDQSITPGGLDTQNWNVTAKAAKLDQTG